MRRSVAERRRADFDFPAPLPRVCSHIREADAGGSAISWGQRWFGARGFEADAENWVSDPFVAERILLPLRLRSATAYVWTHVMISVEANFPSASDRVRSAHVWTYLESGHRSNNNPLRGLYCVNITPCKNFPVTTRYQPSMVNMVVANALVTNCLQDFSKCNARRFNCH